MTRSSASVGRMARLASWMGRAARRWARSRAMRLSEAAGGVAAFEPLESRQLLFALTVDPLDPTFVPGPLPGFGTVTADFAYVMPYLAPHVIPDAPDPEVISNDLNGGVVIGGVTFNPPPAVNIPVIPGQGLFQEFRLRHTANGVTLMGDQENDWLDIAMAVGQTVAWQVRCGPEDPLWQVRPARDTRSLTFMSFVVGGAGFNFDTITVELRMQGRVLSTFTGAALQARSVTGGPTGLFTFVENQSGFGAFDELVIINSDPNPTGVANFIIDDLTAIATPGQFVELVGDRVFGARAVLSGPIGASARFLDLYGNDLELRLDLLAWDDQCAVIMVDRNDDGVPDFNDGIGRIVITGTDRASALTLFGGTVEREVGGDWQLVLVDTIQGFYDDFESLGFGYHWEPTQGGVGFEVTGLPPGPGSVVIGSPFVRDNSSATAYRVLLPAIPGQNVTSGFNRADQGIFVQGGASIGSVYIHGIVHGSSRFTGFAHRFVTGYFVGSATVNGDLGLFVSGTDAGLWVDDDGAPYVRTASQLVVGRTLGEVRIAGRSLLTVSVIGDLNSPTTRPARDALRYFEVEGPYNIPTDQDEITTIQATLSANTAYAFHTLQIRASWQVPIIADSFARNDAILSAEWVGSGSTAVTIWGELGFADPINTREDPVDVYAFPVDGTQDVVVRLNRFSPPLISMTFRLVDASGRTVAAPIGRHVTSPGDLRPDLPVLRYRPAAPGVLYLVIHAADDGTGVVVNRSYIFDILGMAPVAFGSYTTGAGSGRNFTGAGNVLSVVSGSMGAVRVGTGYVTGAGDEDDPAVSFNVVPTEVDPDDDEPDDYFDLRATSISIAGSLYTLTLGSDLQNNQGLPLTTDITIGGHLGSLITGLSPVVGTGPTEGDLRRLRLTVGGSVGTLDVRGGLGLDNDVAPIGVDPRASIVIRTGTNPNLRGDVGLFRVGGDAGADTLSLRTPNGAVLGALLISQDIDTTGDNSGIWQYFGRGNGLDLRLGVNSDLRFFDVPRIDLLNFENQFVVVLPGTPVTLTDDGGAQVRIEVIGGTPGVAGAVIRVLPVADSLGVAIGRITANLVGGARLRIAGAGAPGLLPAISIGRIQIVGADAGSSIGIEGPVEVDVWRIDQLGGEGFNEIVNLTPDGDIVAVDMVALNRLEIRSGDLGRTRMPAWGPQLIGPFLGLEDGAGGDVGGPIGIDGGALTGTWNGELFRPIADSVVAGPNAYLDDVGSPVDPYLDGLIVRTGNITAVLVGGAVGDVIAASGEVVIVTANTAGLADPTRFRGIVGTIYGTRLSRIDIGDGLAARTQSPLASTGIFATDDILSVTGTRIPGAFISSTIAAANVVPGNATPETFPTDGIDRVDLIGGGSYVEAFISATNLDAFWFSFWADDADLFPGTVNQVTGTGANFFRSHLWGNNVNALRLTGGFYDASTIRARLNVGSVQAAGYRNTTIGGGELELALNQVIAGGDLTLLTTFARAGDIADLNVDVGGRVLEVSARHITRSRIDGDVEIRSLITAGDVRGSSVVTGQLTAATIAGNVRSSEFLVAGPLVSLAATGSMTNVRIVVSGPDGRLDRVRAGSGISGTITVAGPVDTIETATGDLRFVLNTMTNQRGVPGNVGTLQAGRDVDVRGDIAGDLTRLVAGRHFGQAASPGALLVRGNVATIDVRNGQMHGDLRVGGTLTQVLIGRAVNRPGVQLVGRGSIVAFGRIETVDIAGDFAGQIVSYSGGIGVITISDGSLLPGAAIRAFDGHIDNIVINRGNLLGEVHADWILFSIRLNGTDDGVFGHLGINPAFDAGMPYDAFRNALPPGVAPTAASQGPRITAGHNIGRIVLTTGSVFEAFISAGRAIGTIDVAGDVRNDEFTTGPGTVIAAGSSIFLVSVGGSVSDAIVAAGVRDFGADGRPGGTGADADTVQSGRIQTVRVGGNAARVAVTAGMQAGDDGLYNTGDERVVLGISYVREVLVGGTVSNVSVFADSPTLTASPGVVLGGTNLPLADPDLSDGFFIPGAVMLPGNGTPVAFTWGGTSGTIAFTTDKGDAFYVPTLGRIVLRNTSLNSQLIVDVGGGTLTGFGIVSNDDASMGLVEVRGNLAGASRIVIDAYVLGIRTGHVISGDIRVGMNVRSIVTGTVLAGNITAAFWARDIVIGGRFGTADQFGEARLDALAGMTVSVVGELAGLVNIERDLVSLTVGAGMNRAQFRAGNTVGSLSAAAITDSRISVGDAIGTISVSGSVAGSQIQSGGDLGADVAPGGVGADADRVSTGTIGPVTVGGDFVRSSLAAGFLRGPDGYFGTVDDLAAPGRSTIASVAIAGTRVGSMLNTEAFRVLATGAIGTVTVGGRPAAAQGNFRVESLATAPAPIVVVDLQSTVESQVWTTRVFFNQRLDASTFGPALSVFEVRDSGNTLIPLIEGVDYVIGPYDSATNAIGVIFSREVTDRDLPRQSGVAGPGVFRFNLDAAVLRATVESARLDGNGDGFAQADEDFSRDDIVGDAGDKLQAETLFVDPVTGAVVPPGTPEAVRVDMYDPVDVDVVLDGNLAPDTLPDINTTFVIRGTIGDHPDTDVSVFRTAGDTDIYRITLKAGQILRLGQMQGPARFAGRVLLNDAGQVQTGDTADALLLPVDPLSLIDDTQAQDFLIRRTGVYYVVVTNADLADIGPGVVPNLSPAVANTGAYQFTLQVFDDGDTGFAADTDSGDGDALVNAPPVSVFAGPNGVFQDPTDPTYDDRETVTIGDFVFRLDAGPDGIRGTADDVVSGTNGRGITSVRRNGTELTTTIASAIGPVGHAGFPGEVAADVDVFHLNNRQPVAAGRRITVTVRLAELGANLGSFSQLTFSDFTGAVQFAIFDVTDAQDIGDGVLVFSPTDFAPVAGTPGTLTSRGQVSYGFDDRGDFFITFVTPGKIGGAPGEAARYAIFLQGVFNTDYVIEVAQADLPQNFTIPHGSQNVFIETRGGTVDWLRTGGLSADLAPFRASVLGFTGSIGGMPVNEYILSNLVSRLNAVFAAQGLGVTFSASPAAFEFQPFSTVFLTASSDPKTILGTNNFGYSQRSDPFNADQNDQAVVFLPSLGELGYTPSVADVNRFIDSLTAAVGRRVGELLGLRISADSGPLDDPIDIMSANSVVNTPLVGNDYGFPGLSRALSGRFDSVVRTDFFLGRQNAFALLEKFLAP